MTYISDYSLRPSVTDYTLGGREAKHPLRCGRSKRILWELGLLLVGKHGDWWNRSEVDWDAIADLLPDEYKSRVGFLWKKGVGEVTNIRIMQHAWREAWRRWD